jgi:hypothetical protein
VDDRPIVPDEVVAVPQVLPPFRQGLSGLPDW